MAKKEKSIENKEKKEKKQVSFEFDKKKIIVLVLIAALILGGFYGFKFYKSYVDKKEKANKTALVDDGLPAILKNAFDYKGHWSEVYMTEIVKRGILRETGENTLTPDGKIIRAQYMVALYTLDNNRTPTDSENIIYFEDVLDNFFYTDAINWGSSNRFITGISPTKFVPNYLVTKQQAVTILFNYYNSRFEDNNDYLSIDLPYKDADKVHSYAEMAMKWAYANNLFVYYGDIDEIQPNADFTRGEVAALLYCYIYNIDENKEFNPTDAFDKFMMEYKEQKRLEEERLKLEEEEKPQKELEESLENSDDLERIDDKVEGLIEENMQNEQTEPISVE